MTIPRHAFVHICLSWKWQWKVFSKLLMTGFEPPMRHSHCPNTQSVITMSTHPRGRTSTFLHLYIDHKKPGKWKRTFKAFISVQKKHLHSKACFEYSDFLHSSHSFFLSINFVPLYLSLCLCCGQFFLQTLSKFGPIIPACGIWTYAGSIV